MPCCNCSFGSLSEGIGDHLVDPAETGHEEAEQDCEESKDQWPEDHNDQSEEEDSEEFKHGDLSIAGKKKGPPQKVTLHPTAMNLNISQ